MKKTITAIAIALTAGTVLVGCSTPAPPPASTPPSATTTASSVPFTAPADDALGGKNKPVKIGVMGPEIQYDYLKTAALAEGIHLTYVNFSDYNTPNRAVASGELDLNQFQHILFLAQYNIESGQPLAALQSTAIYPLALYSRQYKSVAEIPAGAQIAIPNDETNQARAISVLAQNGLVSLPAAVDPLYATPLVIDQAGSKVKIVPVSAEQSPRALDDPNIAGAIINNTFALDANLNPTDALAADDPKAAGSAPFVNIWAGKDGIQNDPVIAELLRLARTKEWQDGLLQQSKNSAVIVDQGYDQLKTTLAGVETQLRSHKRTT